MQDSIAYPAEETIENLCTIELQSYQSLLQNLKDRKNFKFEENYLLAKLLVAIKDEKESYLFCNAQLASDIKTDFLIISKSARLVITFAMDEASTIDSGKLLTGCNFEIEDKWRHLSVIYQNSETSDCASCKHGRIGPSTDISRWWTEVKETSWRNTGSEDGFDHVLKYFIIIIFQKKESTSNQTHQEFYSGKELFFNSLPL